MNRKLEYYIKRFGRIAFQPILNHLEISEKSSYTVKIAQRNIFLNYQSLVQNGRPVPRIEDTGYRIFSQFEEDGLLVFIFALIGMKSRSFVDIGSGDGINSNCANLAINFGWHGLFIDGNPRAIDRGERYYAKHPDTWAYPPKFSCSMVKRSNINRIISGAGYSGEVDLVSIDIDGNDYWIWDAIECIQPRVVCIETHVEFGYRNIVVPYDENYVYPGTHPQYHGASPTAMVKLANRLGYRLIGSNMYGFNTIYVKKGEGEELLPERTVEDILLHPRNEERFKLFEEVKDMEFQEG